MEKRNENERIKDFLFRGVEHFMATLPEEPPDEWSVARPTQTAKEHTIAVIEKINWDGLVEPLFATTLDEGFSFEWTMSGRELLISVNADGSLEYLTVQDDKFVEEESFALEDGKLEYLVAWLKGDPKTHALVKLDQLLKFPEGESSFSASRPKPAGMALARAIVGAIDWKGVPIPIVAAGGDGSIEFKWQMPSGQKLLMFVGFDMIEYLATDPTGKKSEGQFALGELITQLKG